MSTGAEDANSDAEADALIGLTIGNYTIRQKLGAGGMGAVYLAEHPGIGKKVAVKVLLPEHSKRQDLISRFFNEAKTTATLRHPALVEVFDFGFLPDGAGYIVMDFLEGESLSARLRRVAPLDPHAAAEIGRQLAAGVSAAHGQHIVHRDLKPDNVFLVPDPELPEGERVKILDFGIAKLLLPGGGSSKGATSTGMMMGTPLYMAPEQCRGAGLVDHRADVYSVGCILYEMLGGRPPFDYEGVGEILAAHLYQTPRGLLELDPSLPPHLVEIVTRALAKDPAARQQTMAELASDLGRFVRGGASGPLPRLSAGLSTPSTSPSGSRARIATGAGAASGASVSSASGKPTSLLGAGTAPTTFGAAAAQVPVAPEPAGPVRARGSGLLVAASALGLLAVAGAAVWFRTRPPGPGPTPPIVTTPTVNTPPVNTPPVTTPPVTTAPETPPATGPTTTPPGAGGTVRAGGPAATGKPPGKRGTTGRGPTAGLSRGDAPSAATARALALHREGFRQHLAGADDKALLTFRAALSAGGLPASERAEVEDLLIKLGRKFGEIEVIALDGARISLDGRPLGRTPLRDPILVTPGRHEIMLELDGYEPRRRTVTVGPGQREFITVKLTR